MARTATRPHPGVRAARRTRKASRARVRIRRALHVMSFLMVLGGLAVLTAYGLGFSRGLRVETSTATTRLAPPPLPTPQAASAPVPPGLPPGAPLGSLPAAATVAIAAIGLEAPVETAPLVEIGGVPQWRVPDAAAGHGEGTANPGEAGNTVLMGHVQGVFGDLHRAQVGQEITVTNAAGTRFVYEIVDVKAVTPGDVSVVAPTPEPTLTLITCAGQWLPQAHDYTERLIVVGKLKGAAGSPF